MMLAAAMTMLAACERTMTSEELADRSSRLYASAMAELQSGNVDAAIRCFEEVVRSEPGNGNAHFQLAALLEDAKKDYLGAIAHYRQYLVIRPKSDKATVAQDRLRGCETRYVSAVLDKAGLDNKFADELKALREEHSRCGEKLASLSVELDKANRTVAALENEVKSKMRMLECAENLRDEPSVADVPKKPALPTDAELLDEELPGGGKALSSAEMKNLRAMLEEDERTSSQPRPLPGGNGKKAPVEAGSAVKNPPDEAGAGSGKSSGGLPFADKKKKTAERVIPETYTVQEGDTLMRISAKFYGTNRKWRDIREANKTVISTDGRVRAGQVIRLP